MLQIPVVLCNHPAIGQLDVALRAETSDLLQTTVVKPLIFLGKSVLRNPNHAYSALALLGRICLRNRVGSIDS